MRSRIGNIAATIISSASHAPLSRIAQALPRQMEQQAKAFSSSSVQRAPSFTDKLQRAEQETVFQRTAKLYRERGGENYMIGEAITQEAHVLQGAAIALYAGAPERVVIAALMHDIGHVAFKLDPQAAEKGHDTKHEFRGAAYLKKQGFGSDVTDLVQLHVRAKRYLVTTDESYQSQLSPASMLSLTLQGGKMSTDERAAFESSPYAKDAVSLRLIDEMSKLDKLPVPPFASYEKMIARVLAQDKKAAEPKDKNYRENLKALYQQMAKDPAAWEKELRSRDVAARLPAADKLLAANNISSGHGRG